MKKTQKSFRKKALLSSMSMLLVATVAVGSATFAWFTSNKSVTANGMSVKAAAAKGLQITGNSDDSKWGPTYEFTTQQKTLSPISVAYTISETTGDPGNQTTTYSIDKLGTPYYPNSVGTTGKWVSAQASKDITGWTVGKYPEGDIANQLGASYDAVASNGNFIAYQVGLRSTGDPISNLKLQVNLSNKADTTPLTADQYMRVAVLEQPTKGAPVNTDDKLLTVYGNETSPEAISAITPAVSTQTLKSSGESYIFPTDKTITSTPSYYIVLVWFEGQDGECIDTNQSAQGEISITFSYTETAG